MESMAIEMAFPELFVYGSSKWVALISVKPDKCSLFLSHTVPSTSISFAYCSLPEQLPSYSCLHCANTLWTCCCEDLFPVNALAAFVLSLCPYSASPVNLFHLLQGTHTTDFIVVQDLPQLALTQLWAPLPNFHCLWGQNTICHTACQAWHLDFLPLLLGWKTDSSEITVSMHFSLPHIHSPSKQPHKGSNKINSMQIWWQVLFLQYKQHWDLGVENRRGMLTSSCGIILCRSLNARVMKLVPRWHFSGSMSLWKSFQTEVLAYKLYTCKQTKSC